jgi:hypothetical protein
MRSTSWITCWGLCLLAWPVEAEDPRPTLGKLGQPLLVESFDGDRLPDGWTRNAGAIGLHDGGLRLQELAADKHAGAFRKSLPLQDMLLELDFVMHGATAFHVGFDPAAGQLKKKGHLYSLIIQSDGWSIMEHLDKADPQSKNKIHAKAMTAFESGKSYRLRLENKGAEVVASVDGKEPLRVVAADFKVRKPGLVFRVSGKEGTAVQLDNVRVWQLD